MYRRTHLKLDRFGQRSHQVERRAFTLVEMMIVVAIIATLAGLLGAALMKMIPVQVRKNTELSVRKLNTLLQRQWKMVLDQASDEARAWSTKVPASVVTMAGNDPDRIRTIWVKFRLRQQFPRTYAEAVDLNGNLTNLDPVLKRLAPPLVYQKTLLAPANWKGQTVKAADGTLYKKSGNPNSEMAACLLMALTAVNRAGVSTDSDVMSTLEIRDTDGDQVPELVDGWGTPLGFFRWTFGNVLPSDITQPFSTYQFRDPEDPLGRLQTPGWLYSGGTYSGPSTQLSTAASNFQSFCHNPLVDPTTMAALNQYTMPVIMSAGPDKSLGWTSSKGILTTDSTSYDNIYSYDLIK